MASPTVPDKKPRNFTAFGDTPSEFWTDPFYSADPWVAGPNGTSTRVSDPNARFAAGGGGGSAGGGGGSMADVGPSTTANMAATQAVVNGDGMPATLTGLTGNAALDALIQRVPALASLIYSHLGANGSGSGNGAIDPSILAAFKTMLDYQNRRLARIEPIHQSAMAMANRLAPAYARQPGAPGAPTASDTSVTDAMRAMLANQGKG